MVSRYLDWPNAIIVGYRSFVKFRKFPLKLYFITDTIKLIPHLEEKAHHHQTSLSCYSCCGICKCGFHVDKVNLNKQRKTFTRFQITEITKEVNAEEKICKW